MSRTSPLWANLASRQADLQTLYTTSIPLQGSVTISEAKVLQNKYREYRIEP